MSGHHHGEDDVHEDDMFTQAFWDERYAASERIWSGQPNRVLVELAADLAPGRALDVGCGEGADAIWLAERGWRVTGADVSPVALERAARHAAEAGRAGQSSWLHADLVAGDPLPGDNDLVTSMFVHVPDLHFDRVYSAIAAAVRPGGWLLVAGHHPDERHTDLRNPHLSHLLFAPERVTALLTSGWQVEVAEGRPREQVKDGEAMQATDTVVLARREAA
jgi:SAM-dependent methyltransferase